MFELDAATRLRVYAKTHQVVTYAKETSAAFTDELKILMLQEAMDAMRSQVDDLQAAVTAGEAVAGKET